MTTSDIISIVSVVVSGAFALISVVAAIRASKKSNDIQREMLKIEQQREAERLRQSQIANVIPRLDSTHTPGQGLLMQLTLVNTGSSPARNIRVALDGQSIDDIDWIAKKKPLKDITLGAGQHHSWRIHNVARSNYRPPPWDVAVMWDNESGEPGHNETTLDR
jgi:hypothetical protein